MTVTANSDTEYVVITDDETLVQVVLSPSIEIIEVGIQGPPGVIGPRGGRGAFVSVTTDYQMLIDDEDVFVDATGNDVTVTLPDVTLVDQGQRFACVDWKYASTDHSITFAAQGVDLIDGINQIAFVRDGTSMCVESSGSDWKVV